MNNIYGYIRVSTISQREDRQWAALEEFDIPARMSLWTSRAARTLTVPPTMHSWRGSRRATPWS